MDFILASGSIHRKELLLSADFEPKEIVTADIDETPYPDEKPVDYVCRMAKTKAEAVHAFPGCHYRSRRSCDRQGKQ